MKIGIDLLWVRTGICGGTESYAKNLIEGFGLYDKKNNYVLFAALDNAEEFRKYEAYPNIRLRIMPVKSKCRPVRILWENLYLDRRAQKENVDLMFIPVYSKPLSNKKIPYVNVIHDIQAIHYPGYFGRARRIFLKRSWKYDCKSSARIVTVSDYVLNDLIKHYPEAKGKACRIYVPVKIQKSPLDEKVLETKYGIKPGNYFYCVSSMLPHKNLETVLRALAIRKKEGKKDILVISGVGGDKKVFRETLKDLAISDGVIDTGFVSDEERDLLYEHCRLFLFPSFFEGFGMPVAEAMGRGKITVTTRETSLYEISEGKAVYAENPRDASEWAEKIEEALERADDLNRKLNEFSVKPYETENVIKQYAELFEKVNHIS